MNPMTFLLAKRGNWLKPLASPKRWKAWKVTVFPILGMLSCMAVLYWSFGSLKHRRALSFVQRDGTHLMLDGMPFYVNGWNSYWLMDQAVEDSTKGRVTDIFRTGASLSLTVCRTWAFNDGAYNALQLSLGIFDERVFKALDWVIAEARNHGIRLLFSLVNNLPQFGGKMQYVKWAKEEGFGLSPSNDSFFFDPSIRSYFKIYVKTILTRKNHLTGIEYRNDPTIFAWELMNEPQCTSDASGDTLQEWIEDMSEYIKLIDKKHLITVGLEGFYGPPSPPEKQKINPGSWYGTLGSDFLRNSRLSGIDFASAHIYPDQWLSQANLDEKTNYISEWIASHIEDSEKELNKPIIFTEFGLSNKSRGFDHNHRENFYKSIYDAVYKSAKNNGPGAGAFIWQFLVSGMQKYNDDFGVVPGEMPALDNLIKEQSCRLRALRYSNELSAQTTTIC